MTQIVINIYTGFVKKVLILALVLFTSVFFVQITNAHGDEVHTNTDSSSVRNSNQQRINTDAYTRSRQQFNQNLSRIKDKRRQNILKNLDDRINNANINFTSKWNNSLDRLDMILNKVHENYPQVDITSAQESIGMAKEAVAVQSEKSYILEIADEENLRQEALELLAEFRGDLAQVRSKVVEAREQVIEIARNIER